MNFCLGYYTQINRKSVTVLCFITVENLKIEIGKGRRITLKKEKQTVVKMRSFFFFLSLKESEQVCLSNESLMNLKLKTIRVPLME